MEQAADIAAKTIRFILFSRLSGECCMGPAAGQPKQPARWPSLCQPQEPRSVVVKDVALLLGSKERRAVDARNRPVDRFRPDHLIGSEHHALTESGIHE